MICLLRLSFWLIRSSLLVLLRCLWCSRGRRLRVEIPCRYISVNALTKAFLPSLRSALRAAFGRLSPFGRFAPLIALKHLGRKPTRSILRHPQFDLAHPCHQAATVMPAAVALPPLSALALLGTHPPRSSRPPAPLAQQIAPSARCPARLTI